jgi:hypothetical protein
VACLALHARGAHAADSSPAAQAAAQSLFDEARALFNAGRIHEACEKFRASQRLDPRGGTLLDLALCLEKEGRTASAWVAFHDARVRARSDGQADREKFAAEHVDRLAPVLSRLRLQVAADARGPGLSVTLDGAEIPEAGWNTEMPVDPGQHVVRASAPGHAAWQKDVVIGERADRQTVEIPTLAATQAQSQARTTTPDAAAPEPPGDGRRVVGLVVGGAGVVAIAVGAVFGVDAINKSHDAQNACSSGDCGSTAQGLHSDGVRDAWISDFAIGAGVVAAAVGAYLVLTPSRPAATAVRATFTGRGVAIGGSF